VIAATAHPYKFADVVEPLIGSPFEPAGGVGRRSGPCHTKLRALRANLDLDALRHHLNALNETQPDHMTDEKRPSHPDRRPCARAGPRHAARGRL
jgi:threonine synthase